MSSRTSRRKSGAKQSSRQWRRMDLHIHTPGSNDYQESGVTNLDILRQSELRGLDIIAFTDHNTVSGFASMKKEIEQLLWLEQLGRLESDEERQLAEYRRLLGKILVLPGFEFTATFGFHILGIFPSETSVSYLEHLLLTLNVPAHLLQTGSSTVGATSDVLMAYRVIHEAGGIVIGAHANSGNGVAMRGLDFGGQTRIAYTQDPHLHVLEVTDLEKRSRYTTRRFFDGSKPEYPRPMRCIQGSDAHRLERDRSQPKSLGIGERITEILIDEVSFDALSKVMKGTDLALTRAYRGPANPVDFVQVAREEGESIVQAFHASMAQRGGHVNRILQDICAMANTNGGTIYAGVSANPQEAPAGVHDPKNAIDRLHTIVANRLTPEPHIQADIIQTKGKQIVRINVQPGKDLPYAIDDSKFYVRDESETNLAVRDEIARLVKRGFEGRGTAQVEERVSTPPAPADTKSFEPSNSKPNLSLQPPRTGVEIVSSEKRKGVIYHMVRDLRNGNLIKNVTRTSARKLWHYAISQIETGNPKPESIKWQGNVAILNQRKKDDHVWYDLALRDDDTVHIYFGVTDKGLNDEWLALIEQSDR